MDITPTVEDIRTWSDVEFGSLGYPEPEAGEPDRLEHLIPRAEAELSASVSARGVDLVALDPESTDLTVRNKALLAQEIIQRLVEYAAAKGTTEILETAADFNLLQSMSVSGYSESRRGRLGVSRVANDIHPWPLIQRLVDLLIYFDTGGVPAHGVPAVAVPGQDWTTGGEVLQTYRYPWSRVNGSFIPVFAGLLPSTGGWQTV